MGVIGQIEGGKGKIEGGEGITHNYAEKKPANHVCTLITFKQIELEGSGWSGLVWF